MMMILKKKIKAMKISKIFKIFKFFLSNKFNIIYFI